MPKPYLLAIMNNSIIILVHKPSPLIVHFPDFFKLKYVLIFLFQHIDSSIMPQEHIFVSKSLTSHSITL